MTAKPTPLPVQADHIPISLRALRRFVGWKYEWVEGKNGKPGRWTKPPYIATDQTKPASSTDPATWRTFDEALSAVEGGKFAGLGIVLGQYGDAADRLVAVDLDHCVDETGVTSQTLATVEQLNSYAEQSPSGHGVRVLLWSDGLPTGWRKRGDIEIYDSGRYVTLTGHHIHGTPTEPQERTEASASFHAKVATANAPPVGDEPPREEHSDDTLIALAKSAKNGAKFAKLLAGDTTGYPSHSEADMALCEILAFWTNRNATQMDRLFRRSGLMREEKWNRLGADLIAKAIANTPEGYTGSGKPKSSTIIIRRASDVPDEKLETEFSGRLVRGSFGLLSGPGEAGKGMSIMDTIARFTTGEPFPGDTIWRVPANVLICVVEDSMGRVKSRLRAAGADLDRVLFAEGPEVTRGGLKMPSSIMLDDDAGAMVRRAKEHDVLAIFLETTVEHFGDRGGKSRNRSTNNEADMRNALAPLRQVCAEAGLYGLGAIHPNKGAGAIDNSISGSAAFRNVARSVHHIYRDPEDESANPIRLLFTSKANYLAQHPPTLRFQIRSWDTERGGPCECGFPNCRHEGRVVWETDLIDVRTAEEIWQQIAERNKPRRDVAVKEAEDFLKGLMKDGKIVDAAGNLILPKDIEKLAKDGELINPAALKRAKENLGLVSIKNKTFPATVLGWGEEEGGL